MKRLSYYSLKHKPESTFPRASNGVLQSTAPHAPTTTERSIAPSWVQSLGYFLNGLVELKDPDIKVWQAKHRGEILWSAYDPATGKGIRLVPETEVRRWIEQR